MISYRKLAMRVLGHPLRVPTNTPRPASHRVTALALTAAMVAGMAAPAYAGTYYIGDGNITITKDESGTYPLPLRYCSPRCGRYAFHPPPQRLHRQLHRGRRRPQRTAEVSRSPSSIPST